MIAAQQSRPTRLIEAQQLQAKLESQLGSTTKAARITAFWLYLTTFGPTGTRAMFGKRAYYDSLRRLTRALSS